jgi:hypothetical protein
MATAEQQTTSAQACANCKKAQSKDLRLKGCAQCFAVLYCSKQCQIADWRTHKPACTKRKSEQENKAPQTSPGTATERAAIASSAAARDGARSIECAPWRAATMPAPPGDSTTRPAAGNPSKGMDNASPSDAKPKRGPAELNQERAGLKDRFKEGMAGIATAAQAATILQLVDRMSKMQDIRSERPWKETYRGLQEGHLRCVIAADGTIGSSPKYILNAAPIYVQWRVFDSNAPRGRQVLSVSSYFVCQLLHFQCLRRCLREGAFSSSTQSRV